MGLPKSSEHVPTVVTLSTISAFCARFSVTVCKNSPLQLYIPSQKIYCRTLDLGYQWQHAEGPGSSLKPWAGVIYINSAYK